MLKRELITLKLSWENQVPGDITPVYNVNRDLMIVTFCYFLKITLQQKESKPSQQPQPLKKIVVFRQIGYIEPVQNIVGSRETQRINSLKRKEAKAVVKTFAKEELY